MRGRGVFSTTDELMANFLAREGAVAQSNDAFVARNFLLDEGVTADRFSSYQQSGGAESHSDFSGWKSAHSQYLAEKIEVPVESDVPASLDARDPDSCPETFQTIESDSPFYQADAAIHLIRVERLQRIADASGVNSAELKLWAQRVAASPDDTSTNEFQNLGDAIEQWQASLGMWPTFAAFWEDLRDLWDLWEPEDRIDWADELRDWLGLLHLNPGPRILPEIDIIVFRYPVSAVPNLVGAADSTIRPLVPPTVLDGRFSTAFCPAPAGHPNGFTVALNDQCDPVRPEILHPNARFRASHVWRVGSIRRTIDVAKLAEFRAYHLEVLRERAGRTDYAEQTDADIRL